MLTALHYVLFAVGFYVLYKGADFLVAGSSAIAKKLGISELFIGITLVAFGTSTPELFVNLIASAQGNPEISIGNIIGSNIFNALLILGVSALVYPLVVQKTIATKLIPLNIIASLIILFASNDGLLEGDLTSELSRIDGIVFLLFFLVFMDYSFGIFRDSECVSTDVCQKTISIPKGALMVFGGLFCLFIGSKWVVDGAIMLSKALGISQSLVAYTIIAGGTSLPELATSFVAALKKNSDIAIGNVIGSNIFNIFFILGVSAVISPLPFSRNSLFDIGVCVFSAVILYLFCYLGKKFTIDRTKGIILIICYVFYIVALLYRG